MKGKVWKYGKDVNTDVILPGRYLDSYEPDYLASHAMEDLDSSFSKEVRPGDIVVAETNFGCGSSREQAASCLRYCGVQAVVAKSFARLFYRNAINQGIAVIECPECVAALNKGDEVEVDIPSGTINNITTGQTIRFKALPPFVMEIIDSGGLVEHLKKKLG
ncbi:MAG: 3-isopropylmalate dehydratase [Candidatus Proteinoplasmatales archaeon SG8-5]|nr:MAG: 3-isopropylmalate dehydratase [Candidatus Proteinoplasmatales archaeon SG8-5]